MDAIAMEPQLSRADGGKQLTAETAMDNVCVFPALRATQATLKTPQSATRADLPMGTCYPKCMDAVEDVAPRPGVQSKHPTLSDTALVAKMQTFDLEELGLSHAPHKKQEKSIVVDYEDSDGEHPEPRDDAATCAPSACGPLTDVDTSAGRPVSSLRGKSVIFQQESEPASPSTTDSDEEPRCSKVHKLCICEVKLHRLLESCWLVSSGQVYDVTGLVTSHPGGVRSILRKAGGPDCARDMKFHTKNARKMMEKCFIGKLQQCGDAVECADDSNCSIM